MHVPPEAVGVALAASGTWPRSLIAVGVAVSLCESGDGATFADTENEGDENLTTSTWGVSYGAFQIRTLNADAGKGTARDIERLRRGLLEQARAAGEVWQSQGLNAWSVTHPDSPLYRKYLDARAGIGRQVAQLPNVQQTTPGHLVLTGSASTSGGDLSRFMGAALGPLGSGALGPVGTVLAGAADPIDVLTSSAGALAGALTDPDWWRRVGMGALGALVLIIGMATVAGGIGVEVPLPGAAGKLVKVLA